MVQLLVRLFIIALVVYGVWRILQPRAHVRIVIGEYGIKQFEGLPKAQEKEVLRFLQNDLEFDGKLVIRARRQSNGYLSLNFSGQIEPGTKQQIRNFLNTVM